MLLIEMEEEVEEQGVWIQRISLNCSRFQVLSRDPYSCYYSLLIRGSFSSIVYRFQYLVTRPGTSLMKDNSNLSKLFFHFTSIFKFFQKEAKKLWMSMRILLVFLVQVYLYSYCYCCLKLRLGWYLRSKIVPSIVRIRWFRPRWLRWWWNFFIWWCVQRYESSFLISKWESHRWNFWLFVTFNPPFGSNK